MKAETLALIEQRSDMETQMNSIISRLCAPAGPGISGNLLDAEGFPRADIDIPAICAERHRLAVLRSDYKEITERIEKAIQVLHSGSTAVLPQKRTAEGKEVVHQQTSSVPRAEASNSAIHSLSSVDTCGTLRGNDSVHRIPFAVFDEVQEGSPAAHDGIMLGDHIVKFGNVEGGENLLPRLAREGLTNEGHGIPVIVLRRGVEVQLNITPRRWSGPGLLGCHIQPLF